jgi:hypothetical protein
VLGLSLAFNDATVQVLSLFDVRMRLCLRGDNMNVHVVDALMIMLCGREGKGKLIGIATDGARNVKEAQRRCSAVGKRRIARFLLNLVRSAPTTSRHSRTDVRFVVFCRPDQ